MKYLRTNESSALFMYMILYELQPQQATAIRTDTGTQQVSPLTQQEAILLRTD